MQNNSNANPVLQIQLKRFESCSIKNKSESWKSTIFRSGEKLVIKKLP